jgi:type II secretory pathway component PulF
MAIGESPAAADGDGFVVVPLPERQQPAPTRRTSIEPASSIGTARWYQWRLLGRINTTQLVNFCRQFANYLDAGVNLNRTMESLRRQYDRTALGPVIGRLQLGVRRGESLTDAMRRDARVFDPFSLSMMRVAEVRGAVPEMLRMLSLQISNRQRLIRQTKSALLYPAFVIFLSICVAALLTILILPTLVEVMRDLVKRKHIDLPWPTQLLMNLSDFIVDRGWWMIPLCLFGSFFGILGAYRTRLGKAVIDEVLLSVPVIGPIMRWIDTTRFARTLAALLEAGVDIGSSLILTADTLMLVPLRRAVLRAREGILEGETLSASVGVSNRFPVDLIAIMHSAEETGRLPEMLVMVADEYEEKVDYVVKNLGNLLQPVVILIVGGMVGFIAIAFPMGYTAVIADLGSK